MKIYKVKYNVGGSIGKTETVLVPNEEFIESALAVKDTNFRINNGFSKITNKKEVDFDSVKLTDLSVSDLFKILESRRELF